MADAKSPLSAQDLQTAVKEGRLGVLTRRLVRDRDWTAIERLLNEAGGEPTTLEDLHESTSAIAEATGGEPVSSLKRLAAAALVGRARCAEPTAAVMHALRAAGELLFEVGDFQRAAEIFERTGDHVRAADAYAALGAIEPLEAALARDDNARAHRRTAADAFRRFEILLASGERAAAVGAASEIPDGHPDGSALRASARDLERRLCRGRALTLIGSDGRRVRVAETPCLLGRDGLAQVVLRDPSVSRRHATIVAGTEGLVVQDAGSRVGTRIAGIPIGQPFALTGEGRLGLGDHCELTYRSLGPGLVELVCHTGLDRGLVAVVGTGPIPLVNAFSGAAGLSVSFCPDTIRLGRAPGVSLRIAGHLVGPVCDLLVGDVLELESGSLRLEIA